MKILLIDNNTAHLKNLKAALAGHDIETQKYRPDLDFHDWDKQLIILSGGGGEGLEIDDTDHQGALWYQDEMKFVRRCRKPLVGICMGFEVIARAYGQEVPHLGKLVYERGRVTLNGKGRELFGGSQLRQIEAHKWHVPRIPEGFEELASSENGVEIMRKGNKIGTQFHPELG